MLCLLLSVFEFISADGFFFGFASCKETILVFFVLMCFWGCRLLLNFVIKMFPFFFFPG
jgi:hypothetical protein